MARKRRDDPSSDEEEPTLLDDARPPPLSSEPSATDGIPSGLFTSSGSDTPLRTDMLFRRVVATPKHAYDYAQAFDEATSSDNRTLHVEYGKLRVSVEMRALEKMHGWVKDRSEDYTLEVHGRFLGRMRAGTLVVDDFLPVPSFARTIAYPDEDEIEVPEKYRIRFDPLRVMIPFHSHYAKSIFQRGPSPGDLDELHHLKWLFAPVTGLNILYSGIVPDEQVELPHTFPPVSPGNFVVAINPDDCWVVVTPPDGRSVASEVPAGEGLIIGRDANAGLIIRHDSLSRRHLRVFWDEDNLLRVEDLGSRNGAILDGVRIGEGGIVIRRPCKGAMGACTLEIRF